MLWAIKYCKCVSTTEKLQRGTNGNMQKYMNNGKMVGWRKDLTLADCTLDKLDENL